MPVYGLCRFSYLSVFEPRAMPKNDPNAPDVFKYSVSVLIPKENEKLVNKIKADIQAAKEQGIENGNFNKAQAASPTFKYPLRDGDAEHEAGARGPEYAGMWFFNANSVNPPGIVGSDGSSPILDRNDFWSGCWGYVDANFYPYPVKGSKVPSRGIAAGLNNIMKAKDGDRLDGRMKAEDAFAGQGYKVDDDEDAPKEDDLT